VRAHCGRSLSSKPPPRPHQPSAVSHASAPLTAATSLRQLLDSLNREQRRSQELLASLGFALRSFTNLGRFLELLPLVAARLLEAEGCLLLVFHDDGRLGRDHLHSTPSDRCQEVLRQLAAHGDAFFQEPGSEQALVTLLDPLVRRLLGNPHLHATSVVPRHRQRARLYVFSHRSGHIWSDVHRRHLQLVADLAAVALENDHLQQDSRRHERLDRQLSTGAEIQAQLLPDRCPVIEGVELAARCRTPFQVGGDYYDFIPTQPLLSGRRREQGRWALVIGDVMGKGLPASLLMTLLRGMLRAEVLSGLPPDRILHDLNQMAQEDLAHSHRFVTLFYSDYDPLRRLLRFANAAHNPPLHWHRRSGRIDRLDTPGLLIGLQSEADYGCAERQLEPGDVILYYTDGVTEASGFSGERFDEPRLLRELDGAARAGLGAQAILDRLFARLDRFVGADRHLEDDASMVVLKVRDEVTLPVLPS
jgi:sigma-B regulation protein RsbU (phosphoserine phosphatase)